ncbi:DNA repair protein complementing XP-C cells-like isoform X2 [Sycon ciliatum]|uniref:DNA repair protein complementing XP-C cells-like isoform X2 n=1 Tax=Sycon ciliatum TaxID=27933 RepID=UPI0031F63E58
MAGKKRKGSSPGTSPYFQQPATRRSRSAATRSSARQKKIAEDQSESSLLPTSEAEQSNATVSRKPKRGKRVARTKEDKSEATSQSSASALAASSHADTSQHSEYPEEDLDEDVAMSMNSQANVEHLSKKEASGSEDDDDEDVDWEEVPGTQAETEVSTLLSGTMPVQDTSRQTIAVDILKEKPGKRQRPSKQDQLNKLLDKIMRALQQQKHKVHLLCLVASAKYVNSMCNGDVLKAIAMSCIPSQYFRQEPWRQKDVNSMLSWLASTFSVEANNEQCASQLTSVMHGLYSHVFQSRLDLVLAIITCFRALQVSARLVLSLQPVALKWTKSMSNATSPSASVSSERKCSELKTIVTKSTSCPRHRSSSAKSESTPSMLGTSSPPTSSTASSASALLTTTMDTSSAGNTASSSCTGAAVMPTLGECSAAQSTGEDVSSNSRTQACADNAAGAGAAGAGGGASRSRSKRAVRQPMTRKLRCVAVSRSSHSIHSSDSEGVASGQQKVVLVENSDVQRSPLLPRRQTRRAASKTATQLSREHKDIDDPPVARRSTRKKPANKKTIDVSSESGSDSDFVPSQPMRTPRRNLSQSQPAANTSPTKKTEAADVHAKMSDSASQGSSTRSGGSDSSSDSDFQAPKKKIRRTPSSAKQSPSATNKRQRSSSPSAIADTTPTSSSSKRPSVASGNQQATTTTTTTPPRAARRASASRRSSTKDTVGVDCWLEIYIDDAKSWLCVDPVLLQPSPPFDIAAKASQPVSYVIAVDDNSRIKDVTQRYVHDWMTRAKRRRVDAGWWQAVMAAYAPLEQDINMEEDLRLQAELESQPLPTSVQDFKAHPLYVLQRHLLKFEALYPPDLAPIAFIKNEAIYPRSAVHTLHTRETWMKDARSVKEGEEPYKMVKARPKRSTPAHQRGTLLSETFGVWQTEDYVPPVATDGKVPRNTYGNVELFKPSMLPIGCRQIKDIPNLPRIARKLGIDCAEAMVGWDQHCGYSHPIFDGVVVCEEFADTLLDAWEADRAEGERKAEEKREKRILDNWYKLTKGLLIQQKVKRMFSNAKTMTAGTGLDDEEDGADSPDGTDEQVHEPTWSALQPDPDSLPGCQLPS